MNEKLLFMTIKSSFKTINKLKSDSAIQESMEAVLVRVIPYFTLALDKYKENKSKKNLKNIERYKELSEVFIKYENILEKDNETKELLNSYKKLIESI